MQFNRDLHSIGSYLRSIRSYLHGIGSYLHSIGSYFNYFVVSYIPLVYSSGVFYIKPYRQGNNIPTDRNDHLVVVTILSAVKRKSLSLDLMFVQRHAAYDYMTYSSKSSWACEKMAYESQHQSPLELITQNLRSILTGVLNKLECGDVDHNIASSNGTIQWNTGTIQWNASRD